MRKLAFVILITISFMSCEKNETLGVQPENAKVLGEWQLYRSEKLEYVIDQWTGTSWTHIDKWFKNIRQDSPIIHEFKEDGTFLDKYAAVVVAKGTWQKIDDNTYSFQYSEESKTTNTNLPEKNYVTFYCDNTYAIKYENNTSVDYYKILNDTECAESITYYVQD